jgi:hypothetical protein
MEIYLIDGSLGEVYKFENENIDYTVREVIIHFGKKLALFTEEMLDGQFRHVSDCFGLWIQSKDPKSKTGKFKDIFFVTNLSS